MAKHKHTENLAVKHKQMMQNAKGVKKAPQAPRMGTSAYNQFRI